MSEFDDLFEKKEEEIVEKPIEKQTPKPTPKPTPKQKKTRQKKVKPVDESTLFVTDEEFESIMQDGYERVNFNKMPKAVLNFKMKDGHTPDGITLMKFYKDAFGSHIRGSKVIMNRAIIYNCIRLDKILQEEERKRKKQ